MSSNNILATRKGRFASFGVLYITEGIPQEWFHVWRSIPRPGFGRQSII